MLENLNETHLDLFSGIGGFAYAIDQVWDNVEHVFVENDKFCQSVLRKHWKGSVIHGDIKEFIVYIEQRGLYRRRANGEYLILTGGFPCQPFSQAGRRRGAADNRYLWPEMFRVIQLTKPTWVIVENVRGLLTLGQGVLFEQVCADLESKDYEVQPFIIPAIAVNAPHRRDRVWIVAFNTKYDGCNGAENRKGSNSGSNNNSERPDEIQQSARPDRQRDYTSDSKSKHEKWNEKEEIGSGNGNTQNPISKRDGGGNEDSRQVLGRKSAETKNERPDWEKDWIKIAAELCRMDDGLPTKLDGLELSKSAHRKERLKALGNAIVPQIGIEIMRAIKECQKMIVVK